MRLASSVAVSVLLLVSCGSDPVGTPRVSPADIEVLLGTSDAPTLLDVRTAEEFREGHVAGAINISYDELATRVLELDPNKDRQLVVYCRSGRRAEIAALTLSQLGYRNVAHMDGDINAWKKAGRPVAKD